MKPMLKNKRILITGGSGFIGSYLLDNLVPSNEILCFDNSYRGSNTDYLKKKHKDLFKKNIKIIQGDIRNTELLQSVVNEFEPEVVFHLAGLAGVDTVTKKPLETIEVNLFGTYNLISAIKKKSFQKLIYASTSEVYGPEAYEVSEDQNTVQGTAYNRRWSYATSKLFAEHLLVAMEREHGIPVSIARLFNIYGPRQIGEGAIHNFVVKALQNKPLQVYGTGTEIRAWCYIDDCINGLSFLTQNASGIYNIGHPYEGLTSYALATKIIEIANSKSKIVFKPLSYAGISVRVPRIIKIQKLGYKPKINLAKGLQETISWYKKAYEKSH